MHTKTSAAVPATLDRSTIRYYRGCLALLSVALFSSASLRADILVDYTMQTLGARTNANIVASGLVATSLTGNNLNSAPGTLETPVGNFYTTWSPNAGGGTTAANALTTASYFSLTLTPTGGSPLALTSLSFDVFAATAGPSARQLYVFSDKTGYVDTLQLLSASTTSGSPLIPYNTSPGQNYSINLSTIGAFSSISDSVTFRFYLQTPSAGQSLAFDNITVNGTVPEPCTLVLLSLGGLAALAVCHRRRQV